MEKKMTTIKIGGVEYNILGYETEEYMQKVAIYVDKKMNEIKQSCFTLDSTMLAVLTAINLADENIKMYEQIDQLTRQINLLSDENGILKQQLDASKKMQRLGDLLDEPDAQPDREEETGEVKRVIPERANRKRRPRPR